MSESLGGQKQVIFKDGVLYIASSTGGDVLLSTYDGNRDFSLVHSQVINAPSDYLQSEPDIALIDDSHLVIAYQSNTDPTAAGAFSVKGDSDIRFAIYDLLTQEQSVDFVIAQSGAIGLKEPQVAAIGEGRFLITWTETTYDDAAIATHFAQAYSADGSAISDAIEVANYTLGPISPDYPGGVTDIRYAVDTALTAGPSGTAIFAWNQHDLYHSVFDGGVATLELNGTALQLTDKQLITAIDGDSSAGIREPVIYTHPTDGYGVIFNNTPDTALIVPVLSKVDQIAPSIPEIYVVAGDDVVTVDELAGVTVGGTAEPGSTLQLTSNYPDSPVFETIVDLNGKWLFEYADFGIEGTLVDGSYELYATATDAAGNTSDVTTRLVEIDLVDAIEGTTGADTLIGTAGNDEIFSYAGNDFIEDGLGDDYVYAGIGDDTINNIGGTDYFDGGDGVDTLITDVTQFAAGDFVLGFNAIEGTHGRLNSDIGQDTIVGIENFKARGSIDTNIVGDSSANVFETDAGNDTIQGGSGNDTIYSGQGDDSVYGGSGDDVIYASDGRDFEDGGEGNDTLAINGYNTSITDVTYNLLEGSQGITGGPLTQNAFANFENFSIGQTFWGETIDVDWNLTIVGTDDANRIQTSEGNDTIIAGGGNDTLLSGGGNDTIDAGEGLDDVQYEGLRSDYVLSQSGNDVFVSSNLDGSVDTLRNVEFISFGGNGERMTIEEALTGNPVSGTGLSGQVYQWSSHYLLPDVSITGGGLTSTFSGPETDPRFKITNIRTLDGVVKADVVLDAKAALVDNFTLNVKLDDGVVADLTANADLQSSGWQTVSANVEGGVSFGGFALSTNLTGEHVVAELTLGGSADASNLVFTIADSAIGADASETLLADYEVRSTVFQASTTQAGDYLLSGAQGVSAPLDVSKNLTATDEGRVISAADALAALKIAVGLNPNLNSSGEGFATSSYQYLAADVNEDGRVSAADALAILKMAVKLDGASEREWVFLREDAEITNPDGTSSFSRSSVDWSETDTAIGVGDAEVNFVGLLRGDVNGSWSDDTLNQLDVSYFDGFANAEQWWVV
jgi:Ca2+-binding RTX toxin-like protein